jgi:hypothetical protein
VGDSPSRQPFYATRHYIGQTNVLETTFTTTTGVLSLTDLMPIATESEKSRELFPDHEILRKLDCREGKVEIEVVFEPRPDYARAMPRFVESSALGYFYEYREQILTLRCDLSINISADLSTIAGRELLRAGETVERYRLEREDDHTFSRVLEGPATGIHEDWPGTRQAHAAEFGAHSCGLPSEFGRHWTQRFCFFADRLRIPGRTTSEGKCCTRFSTDGG